MVFRLGMGLGIIPASARPAPTTAPVNDRLPAFIGILTQGETASIDPGDWSGLPSPNFAYSVQRSGSEVGTADTYTWTADDVAAGADAMTVEVTATNDIGSTPAESLGVTIAAVLAISGTPGAATVSVAYSFTPSVSGGHTAYSFALTGTLPDGLSLNASTGEISGTPTSSGTAAGLDITVTDADGLTDSLGAFSIVVSSAGEPAIYPMSPDGLVTTGHSLASGFEVPAGEKGITKRSQGYNGSTVNGDLALAGCVENAVSGTFTNYAHGSDTPATIAATFAAMSSGDKALPQFTMPFRNEIPNEATIPDVVTYDLTHMATIWAARTHDNILICGATGAEGRMSERWGRRILANKALWTNYSGFVIDLYRELVIRGTGAGQDLTDQGLDKAPFSYVDGTDGPDYVHLAELGNQVCADVGPSPFRRAVGGLRPFITTYEEVFLSGAAAATAQTNGGTVHTIGKMWGTGDFSLPAQTHSAHFAIDSATGEITRASATVLTSGIYDLTVRVTNGFGYREGVRRIFFGKTDTTPKIKTMTGTGAILLMPRAVTLPSPAQAGGFAVRVRPTVNSVGRFLMGPSNGRIILQLLATNRWNIIGKNGSGTTVANVTIGSALTHTVNTWGWLLVNWDLAASPTINIGLHLDGGSISFASPTVTTLTASQVVDWTGLNCLFCGTASPTVAGIPSPFIGDLHQFLGFMNGCPDWTNSANRDLIYDATTRLPVDVGSAPVIGGFDANLNLGELSAGDLAYGNVGNTYGLNGAPYVPVGDTTFITG